jgi:nitric oxide reductase subunit C
MANRLTKTAARNIFYGGSIAFLVIFLALGAHSHYYAVTDAIPTDGVPEDVAKGKRVWEENSCINCHTIMGEGAYFAPELVNVWTRYGGDENPEAARAALKAWIRAQPTGAPGRRQMPDFDLSDQELHHLIDFLKWSDQVDTQGWPPTEAG